MFPRTLTAHFSEVGFLIPDEPFDNCLESYRAGIGVEEEGMPPDGVFVNIEFQVTVVKVFYFLRILEIDGVPINTFDTDFPADLYFTVGAVCADFQGGYFNEKTWRLISLGIGFPCLFLHYTHCSALIDGGDGEGGW
jgi:hypothetical protein